MAARENQGLQIALIIFVMLTIVLIVTTYMFFRSYSDERDKGKSLSQQNTEKDTKMREAIAETADLKNLVGAAQTDNLDAVKQGTTKEMQTHGEGLPDSKQNYRALVEHLVTKLRKFETANTALAAQVKELNEKLKTDADGAKAEVAKYAEQLNKAATDLEQQRKTFGDDRTQITAQKDQLKAGFDTTLKQHEAQVQTSTDQISKLTENLTQAERLLSDLRSKEERDKKAIEFPDGKIVRVSQRERRVWLNVGTADGLRPQTSFVVVAPEDGNPIKSTPKGTVEVVQLTGPHQAEAIIVEDDLSSPLMPGDQVFSVVWDAGAPEHFALAGTIDINQDGESDPQQIRSLIALNGAIVDAEVTDDGRRSGKMSVNTKYLVLGEKPGADSKDRDAYGELLSEAERLGVKTINVDDFVKYMGYKDAHRMVQMGSSAKASDFKARLPDGRQRVMPTSSGEKEFRTPSQSTRETPN